MNAPSIPNLGTIVPKGAAFHINGLWIFVPETAPSTAIFDAMDLLDAIANERWVAETSTEIMGT